MNRLLPVVASVLAPAIAGCGGVQTLEPDARARTAAESFYREAPWIKARPRDFYAMANALVGATQGLASRDPPDRPRLEFALQVMEQMSAARQQLR
jgi:hypothetical protein